MTRRIMTRAECWHLAEHTAQRIAARIGSGDRAELTEAERESLALAQLLATLAAAPADVAGEPDHT